MSPLSNSNSLVPNSPQAAWFPAPQPSSFLQPGVVLSGTQLVSRRNRIREDWNVTVNVEVRFRGQAECKILVDTLAKRQLMRKAGSADFVDAGI